MVRMPVQFAKPLLCHLDWSCMCTQWLFWDLGSNLPCYPVLKIFAMLFRIRLMHVQFVKSSGFTKTLQVTFLNGSSTISPILLGFPWPPFLILQPESWSIIYPALPLSLPQVQLPLSLLDYSNS